MRASIIITSRDEGDRLWRTVQSCMEATRNLECEVVIADDASTDDSVKEAQRRFPEVRVASSRERRGVSPTRDMGARSSRGDVLLFIDGHCKPEPDTDTCASAVQRLVEDVEELEGQAIVTPRIPHLHCPTWENRSYSVGYGYRMDLHDFQSGWTEPKDMRSRGRFYEGAAFIGCCGAVSRELYDRLLGFDTGMLEWGAEDIDFGLKAWLLGHDILLDLHAAIGHRFAKEMFPVPEPRVLANKIRMARKNFTDPVWEDWAERRREESEVLWNKAWELYSLERESLEEERRYLFTHRVRDEFAYAEHFGLDWPRSSPGATTP